MHSLAPPCPPLHGRPALKNGLSVPFRVTTKKGQPPVWQYSPEGLRLAKLKNTV